MLAEFLSPVLGWESEEIKPLDIIDIVNRKRQEVGSPILHPDPKLMEAAQLRAEVMLKTQHVDHQDPFEGLNLASVLPKVNYKYLYASENIALAQGGAEGIVNGFLNSPSHKQNLLDKNLIETGVGVVKGFVGPNYAVIIAHLFASPQDQSVYQGLSTVSTTTLVKARRDLKARLRSLKPGDDLYAQTTRRLEILDILNNFQDPKVPYTNTQFDLLEEYRRLSETP